MKKLDFTPEGQMEKAKGLFGEFKAFITRGNVLDMAVGIIIGSAFTAIVTSLVNDVIMPVISKLTGGTSFDDWKWVITPAQGDVAESALYWGKFISSIVNFLIIAFVVFLMVKFINGLKAKQEALAAKFKKQKEEEAAAPEEPAPIPEDIQLLREIRDALKEKK